MFRGNSFKQKTDKQWQGTISTYPVSVISAGVCWKADIYHHLSGNLSLKKGVYPEHFCTFCVVLLKSAFFLSFYVFGSNFTTLVANVFPFFLNGGVLMAFCYLSRVVVVVCLLLWPINQYGYIRVTTAGKRWWKCIVSGQADVGWLTPGCRLLKLGLRRRKNTDFKADLPLFFSFLFIYMFWVCLFVFSSILGW